jgi:hypothetical protein
LASTPAITGTSGCARRALLIAAGADLRRLTEWIEEGQQRAERLR